MAKGFGISAKILVTNHPICGGIWPLLSVCPEASSMMMNTYIDDDEYECFFFTGLLLEVSTFT